MEPLRWDGFSLSQSQKAAWWIVAPFIIAAVIATLLGW